MPKGGKKNEEKKEEEEVTEYDSMNLEMLREVIPMLRQQLEKAQIDRNYVQLERDTVNSFYEITKREVKEYEMATMAKDREMELMEENHRVEVRVYMQKVKHLDYEHKHSIKKITSDGRQLLHDEHDAHEEKERGLKTEKLSLKNDFKEKEIMDMEEIMQLRHQHEKNIQKMREGFDSNLKELRTRCQDRLKQLEDDLELRRKVDIHEIEERKNQHINDLMKNHDKAFGQMKAYYNDITNDNLKLIKSLKDDLSAMKKKAVENQKLMYDISQENKKLSLPLAEAVGKVAELQAALRDREKDKLSLRNAKARLAVLEGLYSELQERASGMEEEFRRVEKERDEIYGTFQSSIRGVQEQSDYRNVMLSGKIQTMESNIDRTSTQINEVVASSNLDPTEVTRMTDSLNDVLMERNNMVKELQYMVTRASKTYNDTLRSLSAKLTEFGIPEEEVESMGYEPLPTAASLVPAGLVAK